MHLKKIKKGLAISLAAAMIILSNTYSIKAMDNEDYSPETNYSENANSEENDITGLTDEEFDTLYNQFLEHYKNVNFNSDDENIDAFIEYAIAVGAIEDTPQARDALSVLTYRKEMRTVVAGGRAAGYTTSAELLEHSLQDKPSNKTYKAGSRVSNQIKNSSEYKKELDKIRNTLKSVSGTSKSINGSMALTSTTDLHLAFHAVSYTANCKKVSGKWNITVTVTDRYDFAYQKWGSYGKGLSNAAKVALNNYGYNAQKVGAIKNYNVSITINS